MPQNRTRALTVVLAMAMVLTALAPMGAVAAQSETSDELSVSVTDAEDPTVEVTEVDGENESPVEDASVNVTLADENASYEGEGDHETDENGTVDLPAPEENVTVEVTATADNESATTTADLEVADEEDDENESSFGSLVSDIVEETKDDNESAPGLTIASWVTENNPGNAPDDAGPPEDAGPSDDEKDSGKPPWAGDQGDDEENATNDDESDDAESEDDESEDGESDGETRGPPEDAGR